MKTHKSIRITEKLLKREGACREGLAAVMSLLPAKVSTDPEENLELAVALCYHNPRFHRDALVNDLAWLSSALNAAYDTGPDHDYWEKSDGSTSDYRAVTWADPYLIAQRLAQIADRLLSQKGR